MEKARKAQKTLTKPFKSPTRGKPSTPSGGSNKRSLLDDSDYSPQPPRSPTVPKLGGGRRRTLGATPTRRNKRARLSMGDGGTSTLSVRDKATRALLREKTALQSRLSDVKEEIALLERAVTLEAKKEGPVVQGLIGKWQVACSSACDDLFALLKPTMEAQRQADQSGFGSHGFDDGDDNSKAKQNEEEEVEVEDEDIDIAYMLKRFGIDPDLF